MKRMGRADLIGNGKRHLVPALQPTGTGEQREGQRITPKAKHSFRTQHCRAEKTDHQNGKTRKSSQTRKKRRI
ncbi:MAG: DUF3362 domain-containing protein [Desulfobacterales bacterium]